MDYSKDTQLENELQELYILAKHWFADLDFLEEELRFFKNIQQKYPVLPQDDILGKKVLDLETHLSSLRVKIPAFLAFLKPFITEPNKEMDLGFLENYNKLSNELKQLFSDVRTSKKELFVHCDNPIVVTSHYCDDEAGYGQR